MERARRLRKGREFDSAYSEGIVTSGPLLVLRHRPNGGRGSRWGFAVGKRIAPKATARNRLRRRLREAAEQFGVAEGEDLVVTARQAAVSASFAEVKEALELALRKAGVLNDGGRQ